MFCVEGRRQVFIFSFSLLIFLYTFILFGLWSVDIGVSGMLIDGSSVSGFSFVRSPVQQYHLGLVVLVVSSFLLVLFYVFLMLDRGT